MRVRAGVAAVVLALAGCGADPGDAVVDELAGRIARDVEVALANLSPGEYSAGGVSYLTAEIERRRGTVLGSEQHYTVELDELQAWVDARFTVQVGGGFFGGEPERTVASCLRFEVRWSYGDPVTHDRIDCP